MSTPIRWGSELLVNTTTAAAQSHPTLTALAEGRLVVGCENTDEVDTADVRTQIFDARLTAVQLYGTALSDDCVGLPWTDVLGGRCGNDTLRGAAGNDALSGRAGTDALVGGAGNDHCTVDSALDTSAIVDTITDFFSTDGTATAASPIRSATLTGAPTVSNLDFVVT